MYELNKICYQNPSSKLKIEAFTALKDDDEHKN